MAASSITSVQLTRNITLLSTDQGQRAKIVNFKINLPQNKPLVVMLSWLLANRKHTLKYAEFYLARGCDVLSVSVNLWQLIWPPIGMSQEIARNILKFLECNTLYQPLLIHGFSVGGFLWSEALLQIEANRDGYQNVVDRIGGQIWDSLPHFEDIIAGFPIVIFPRIIVLQFALRQGVRFYMTIFKKCFTRHYERVFHAFQTNIVKAPALFFVSKSDPIGREKSNLKIRENWENLGIQIFWKSWDKSPHVGHFRRYPEEYKAELLKFLEYIGFGLETKELTEVKSKL